MKMYLNWNCQLDCVVRNTSNVAAIVFFVSFFSFGSFYESLCSAGVETITRTAIRFYRRIEWAEHIARICDESNFYLA